jgi:glucosamine--fructose-6-phosphate aminotransferase (isomerizing)
MKETSYVVADPYSNADFLHGPVAILDATYPSVVVAPSGKPLENIIEFVGTLVEKGSPTLVLSDRPEACKLANESIALPTGVPEWLSPIISIVPGQIWARALALAKGIDPEKPRGLNKITLTH